jgi:ATP-dependent exoDNAse (exonuclease V) alpha subunit
MQDFEPLSDEQRCVIEAFDEGKNIFVTGCAGTGKSYILNYLKKHYLQKGLAITASTGIAAVNVSGSTIHSFAGIGLANIPVEQIIENLFSRKLSKTRHRIISTKSLAIDEISMISDEVLDILDKVFRAVRQNEKPFGGLQIALFGDFLQLPPVEKKFCFISKSWEELDLQVFDLKKTFRQTDEKFIKILNNLRFGKIDESAAEALESRIAAVDENKMIKPTILTSHNYKADQINSFELKKIQAEEFLFEAKYSGDERKIETLKKNCLAYQTLKLKASAQVMMLKNTYQKDGVINGSLGVVKGFSPKKNYPIVEFSNGKILTISPEEWLIERFDDMSKKMITEAQLSQVPLIYSWAITIHKSQGLTMDKISCDLSDIFSDGQGYVALSRARSLSGVFIRSIDFKKIKANENAIQFYERTLYQT